MKLLSLSVIASLLFTTSGAAQANYQLFNAASFMQQPQVAPSSSLRAKLMQHETFDDALINEVLISKRPKIHHLLYDEVIDLVQQFQT